MVKFSKELEAQLIPEWKDAFLNYWQLKKLIKKIKVARERKHAVQAQNSHAALSIFDPIRALVNKISDKFQRCSVENPDDERIQVTGNGNEDGSGSGEEETYDEPENELAQLFSEEDEVKRFFAKLDAELEKVDEFYKMKEGEFVERGEILNNQLEVLFDLKQVLNDRRKGLPFSSPSSNLYNDNNIDFSEGAADEVIATLEKKGIKSSAKESTAAKLKKKKLKTTAVRIEIPATTPTQTVAALTSMRWGDLVSDEANNKKDNGSSRDYIPKKKIQCAEKIIRGAFVELYRGLKLLKLYSSLNMVAFVKILKKFDKVSKQQASATYLSQVKRSHFISSDKVVGLMDEVETIFTQHYADNDRKKAMKFLIPQRLHKDSHMVPFFAGLFTGCFMTLFSVYGILAHLSGMFSPGTESTYLETVYPVFSIFGLLSLHLFMYGCNLYLWKKTRINYNFIFEFQPNTALKHSDAFLICTSLMTVVMGAMLLHLLLFSRGFSPNQVNAIPGFIFLCFLVLVACPLNIFYRSTRFCFLRVMRNIVCSPLYKVLMVDFFMADQLTSQIPLLRHMETTVCYYVAGSFKSYNSQACKSGKLHGEFAYMISFAPYFWRALQCGRKWFDDNDVNQLANLGKYVSAMVAVCARLTYARHPESQIWLAIVLATSVIATIYQLYWDLVKDWGFFSHKSKNPYLRDNLILKNKIVYYVSIALNVVLRLAWVETVMRFNVGMLESRLLDFSLASLEVIRRGHWNFYRLENEHLNNVGKFRAVKEVPLPFYET